MMNITCFTVAAFLLRFCIWLFDTSVYELQSEQYVHEMKVPSCKNKFPAPTQSYLARPDNSVGHINQLFLYPLNWQTSHLQTTILRLIRSRTSLQGTFHFPSELSRLLR